MSYRPDLHPPELLGHGEYDGEEERLARPKPVPRREQKPYKLTAPQWRELERLAKAHPKPGDILDAGTRRALEARALVELAPDGNFGRPGHRLTELGQRVYARLSVGRFCRCCGKPITFQRRVLAIGMKDVWECEPCAARTGGAR